MGHPVQEAQQITTKIIRLNIMNIILSYILADVLKKNLINMLRVDDITKITPNTNHQLELFHLYIVYYDNTSSTKYL